MNRTTKMERFTDSAVQQILNPNRHLSDLLLSDGIFVQQRDYHRARGAVDRHTADRAHGSASKCLSPKQRA